MIHKPDIKLLVIDDDQALRDVIVFELQADGYQVDFAENGREGVDKAKKTKFDLIITDMMMPVMNGLEALDAIKKHNADIEAIMITGEGSIEIAVEAMKKGAFDFVQKPFEINELKVLIERALEKNELKMLVGLYKSSQAIFSSIKLDELLDIVLDLVSKTIQGDQEFILLVDPDGQLYLGANHNTVVEKEEPVLLKFGNHFLEKASRYKNGLLVTNGLQNHEEFSGFKGGSNINSALILPLFHKDRFIGILNVFHKGETNFTETDLHNSLIYASQLSQAIENAQLYQAVENKMRQLEKAYSSITESRKVAETGHQEKSDFLTKMSEIARSPITATVDALETLISPPLVERTACFNKFDKI